MTELYYWDACVFLAWLQNEPDRETACRDTIERAKARQILLVTSALTIAEVLWTKSGPQLTEEKARLLNRFFKRSYIRVVNVDRRIAEDAQKLVWADGVRPKDSIHVATAVRRKCSVLETYDTGLLSRSGQYSGLAIREPQKSAQGSLGI